MENTEQTNNPTSSVIIAVIVAAIIALVIWQVFENKESEPTVKPVTEDAILIPTPEKEPHEGIIKENVATLPLPDEVMPETVAVPIEDVVEINPLPLLDESDGWLQDRLSEITWRKELLKMVIDEDIIRRFVVFADNFARGDLAHEHSPIVLPKTVFSAIETKKLDAQNQEIWLWDEKSTKRYSVYVELLRSFDSETLVNWYIELKPLIDQAYNELGYPDSDFTDTLQQAIARVLDMEIPKGEVEIIRPSVMFQYKDDALESLDDADKLLLRLGRENLLIIKSVLLEINEKIARKNAN